MLRTGHFRIYLYTFNVSLFFFLLGYTFKNNESFKMFFKKRFLRTMVPYYVWAVISIVIFLFMAKFLSFDVINASMSLWKNLAGMLYANSRTIYMRWNLPLWFVPCMNLTLIIVWIVEYVNRRLITENQEKFRVGVCMIFAVIGIIIQQSIDIKFPFQFESAILMTVFVELGLVFKTYKVIEIVSSKKVIFVCFVLLIVGIVSAEINGMAEVRTYAYGKYPILFLIAAFVMTLFVSLFSYKINDNFILKRIGEISFPILLMHKFPILFFNRFYQ